MDKPILTQEMMHERMLPGCPHCGADMDGAAVSLVDIVENAIPRRGGGHSLKIDAFVNVDAGGFADAEKAAVVSTCPACRRPVVLAMDVLSVKLIAARTPLDRRYMEERPHG